MILKELELYSAFRGLQKGFKISFQRSLQSLNHVEPLCLVGINGSGKSNMMQVVAEIFFYLEAFVLPEAKKFTKPDTEFGFRIHYRLPVTPRNVLPGESVPGFTTTVWRDVIISKNIKEIPFFRYYYNDETSGKNLEDSSLFHRLLPNQVIGYSSGMNEMISVPFTKMDFYYLDVMKEKEQERVRETDEDDTESDEKPAEKVKKRKKTNTPWAGLAFTNPDIYRLFFLDYHSNALAVMANYLLRHFDSGNNPATGSGKENEPATEMEIINRLLGIRDLSSFRVSFNYIVRKDDHIANLGDLAKTAGDVGKVTGGTGILPAFLKRIDLPYRLKTTLTNLMDCSTTINITKLKNATGEVTGDLCVEMYFKVDAAMRQAFRNKFPGGPMKLFGELYLLNLMNIENYNDDIQRMVKEQQLDSFIGDFLPRVSTEDKVFHVDEIKFKKNNGASVYYKQLSDGEHQYLQVTGALMLINENASLFLMDEPETHYNPEWRSKLISTLNQIREKQAENDPDFNKAMRNYEMLIPKQEIMLTTHSPFVVSDCQKENVYIFERDKESKIQFRKPEINTYGTSVNILMNELFKSNKTIAKLSLDEIDKIKKSIQGPGDIEKAKESSRKLGDSVEKVLLFNYINEMEKKFKSDAGTV